MAPKTSNSTISWSEIGSAAVGATVGTVLGMLFSPQSGRKNRALLAKEGKKIVSAANSTVKKVQNEIPKPKKKSVTKPVRKSKSLSTKK